MDFLNGEDMQEFLQTSKMGFWKIEIQDGESPYFYANKVMNELLGTSEEMDPQERFRFHRTHVHQEDRQLFGQYSDKLTEGRAEIVYRYIHPIAGEMYVRCGGKRDESVKDRISIIGFHQDISDTIRMEKDKLAEQRLAEMNQTLRKEHLLQQDYYRELLDVQSCGVMAYTLPGHRIVHMNAEALRMYGYNKIEEVQKNLGSILGNLHYPNPQAVEKLKKLRNHDGEIDYEFIIHQGTEKECHAVAKTKKIRSLNGEQMVITTFLDVSAMVLLKNALQKAEEGSRAKTAFLFNMSHDLRTPMNAIIGYAELMERHWGEEAVTTEYLQKLKNASRFLLSLINNVLEMARIESGKEILNESEYNLREVDEMMDTIMAGAVQEKKLKFLRKVSIRHEDVICDPLKVHEIFLNIFSNAVKYTPEGGTITAVTEELPCSREGYGLYRTSISDTGIGIDEEYMPHLFESFSREKTSSESGITGSGLGLSIVKSLVEMMQGTIEVKSERGKGTTFSVTLPYKIIDKAATQVTDQAAADMEKHSSVRAVGNISGIWDENAAEGADRVSEEWERLRGKRILLAEDNELNAEITVTILKDEGILTEVAADGEQAVKMLKEAPDGYYDLILMDVQMPVMNGYDATRQIRKLRNQKKASIPVIAMTANAFEEDRNEAFAAGMDEHVAKPVEIKKLMKKIAKYING